MPLQFQVQRVEEVDEDAFSSRASSKESHLSLPNSRQMSPKSPKVRGLESLRGISLADRRGSTESIRSKNSSPKRRGPESLLKARRGSTESRRGSTESIGGGRNSPGSPRRLQPLKSRSKSFVGSNKMKSAVCKLNGIRKVANALPSSRKKSVFVAGEDKESVSFAGRRQSVAPPSQAGRRQSVAPPSQPGPRKVFQRRNTQLMGGQNPFSAQSSPNSKSHFDPIHLRSMMQEWPMFEGCDPEVVAVLAHDVVQDAYEAGKDIVQKGSFTATLFFVLRGVADLVVEGHVVASLAPNQYIGEALWLDVEKIWTVTVRAKVNCIIGTISRDKLLQAVEESPEFLPWVEIASAKRGHVTHSPIKGAWALFDGLQEETVTALSRLPVTRLYFPGQELIKEGDHSDELFMVAAGKVTVMIHGCVINTLDIVSGNPMCFGELGLIGLMKSRTATVMAQSIVLARVLYRQAFVAELCERNEALSIDKVTEAVKGRITDVSLKEKRGCCLKEVSLFKEANCSEEFLSFLSDNLQGIIILEGQMIVDEDSEDTAMYFLTHGSVQVMKKGVKVARLKEGVAFGEMVLLGLAEKRTASIIAEETCYAEKLHQNIVMRGLELFPKDRHKIFVAARIQMEEESHVSSSELFKQTWTTMDEELVNRLSEQASERLFLAGGTIINEGELGRSMFMLVTGTAGVFARGEIKIGGSQKSDKSQINAKEQVMTKRKTLRPGSIFGELAMLGIVRKRSATIKAETTCLLLEVTHDSVQKILASHPEAMHVFTPVILKSLESSAAHRLLSMRLFKSFDRNFKMLLGFECLRRVYFPKEVIVKEGQVGEGVYIVNEGQATATANNIVVLALMPGSHFGGTIMTGIHKKALCNLTAVTVCNVLIITHQSYSSALVQYPTMEASHTLHRVELDAHHELAKVVYNAQMRSDTARSIFKIMGFSGAESQEVTQILLRNVFEAWVQFLDEALERKEKERKASLLRWDTQRRIYNARDGHQQRLKKEQETIQHVWQPRGGPAVTADASSPRHCRALQSLDLGTRPASSSQEDAWYLETMGSQSLQTAREFGSERRRGMIDLYLPAASAAQKVCRSKRLPTNPLSEVVLRQRGVLAEMLEERP